MLGMPFPLYSTHRRRFLMLMFNRMMHHHTKSQLESIKDNPRRRTGESAVPAVANLTSETSNASQSSTDSVDSVDSRAS